MSGMSSGKQAARVLLLAFAMAGGALACAICLLEFGGGVSSGSETLALVALSFAASGPMAQLIQDFLALAVKPRRLARMDFSGGVPASSKTVVVVPCLLRSADEIDRLFADLEAKYLENADEQFGFGLLGDFSDGSSAVLPTDDALIAIAHQRLDTLNVKHGPRFFLFRRARQWSECEQTWMGHERKRGKLMDFAQVLLGHPPPGTIIAGASDRLDAVRYVITLDADSGILPGNARKWVEIIAHPDNRPRWSDALAGLAGGHGVLQPRPTQLPTVGHSTRYQRVWCDETVPASSGSLYSDLYQDVFEAGSYYGKGIFDVAAFSHALQGRIPDNTVLSHDILEGCYARSARISDLVVTEPVPPNLLADFKRWHRWVRGDWQLISWLLPSFLSRRLERRSAGLTLLARWKIADNLRRSLVPSAQTAALVLVWFEAREPSLLTPLLLLSYILPSVFVSIPLWGSRSDDRSPDEVPMGKKLFARQCFNLVFLTHAAYVSLDAIARALWRMAVSRKRVLEWDSPVVGSVVHNPPVGGYMLAMWFSLAANASTFFALLVRQPNALYAATPVLVIWCMAPFLAWWLGQPCENSQVS